MKIKNYTKCFNTKKIREIISFVKPNKISNFDVSIKRASVNFWGRAYYIGFYGNPQISVRVNPNLKFPQYSYGHYKKKAGYLDYPLFSTEEILVKLIAHELRHLWQYQNEKGHRVWGSRGQMSERDADAYALHKLREWRRK
jgi:hypothetical protein